MAKAADQASELLLKPCTVQLVDGQEVAGQLAYQGDSLVVVYSPNGGTLRSFPKALVQSLTAGGSRTEMNAARPLTGAEKDLLGRIDWPDAVPAKGRKPAYATEKWPSPKCLMIWKAPGSPGILGERDNWIILGDASSDPKVLGDTETDILLPAAEKPYKVQFGARAAGTVRCRHIMVGRNATLNPAATTAMTGNMWIARDGMYRCRYTTTLSAGKNTFFLNDQPRLTPESPGAKRVRNGYIIPHDNKYSLSQYVNVSKGDESVEFVGTVATSDDFQMLSGTVIVAEDAQLWPGTRSVQYVRVGTTLRLMSGAEYGKAYNAPGSGYGFKYSEGSLDVVVAGRVEAGSPDHPITKDVHFNISFKAPVGFESPSDGTLERRVPGAIIGPGAQIRVHTTDPAKAKLVIGWHRRHNAWFESRLKGYKEMPEEIAIGICGSLMLENVRFENVAKEGLLMEDPSAVDRWKNVTFGESCRGTPKELIVKWPDSLRMILVSKKWDRR